MGRGFTVVALLGVCLTVLPLSGCFVPVNAIDLSPTELNIDRLELPVYLQVWNRNTTVDLLEIEVVPSRSWIITDPILVTSTAPEEADGPFDRRTIEIRIDRTNLRQGTHNASIAFRSNGVETRYVDVRVIQDETGGAAALQIVNPETSFTEPYLLDFSFSLRDARNNAVVAEPGQFSLTARENLTAAGEETGVHLKRGAAQQLKVELVLDYTQSMQEEPGAIAAMESAAKDTFLGALNEDALVGLFEFHADHLEAGRVAARTVDRTFLRNRIDAIQTEFVGGFYSASRAWDAMLDAVETFGTSNARKEARYVVLLSDGDDTSSTVDMEDVLDEALDRNVRIYAIGFGEEVNALELDYLAEQSGGAFFPADSVDELDDTFQEIVDDLSGQYTLRWATLRRSSEDRFDPSFAITLNGESAAYSPNREYDPTDYAGDVLQGELRLVTSNTEDTATVFLRAVYMPRFIREMSLFIGSLNHFTVALVGAGDDGLISNWDIVTEDDAVNGGVWIDVTSPDGDPIPFATFGPLLRLDFGVPEETGTALINRIYVDDTIYPSGQYFAVEGFSNDPPTGGES